MSKKVKTLIIRGSDRKILATYIADVCGAWDEANEPPSLETTEGAKWDSSDDDGTLYATGCVHLAFRGKNSLEAYDVIDGDCERPLVKKIIVSDIVEAVDTWDEFFDLDEMDRAKKYAADQWAYLTRSEKARNHIIVGYVFVDADGVYDGIDVVAEFGNAKTLAEVEAADRFARQLVD